MLVLANMVKIYCLQEEDLCLQIFLYCIGSQQVLITKVNSHMMLFNFQYILKNSCTLYTYVVRFPFELIVIEIYSSEHNNSTKKL